jgi:hypothetical protein
VEIAAIAAAAGGLLFTGVVIVSALAAVFRKRADTRRDAYRVLRLLLRSGRRH